ncbi:hypothetical protein [Maricaulis sp.]|uniref:hypothetical protein n=1 Tax=Maricaulis sp. TaxID=1486257 RepID=UPI002B2686A3|nr:hypothetical protein [Maricaulis sp.]
MAESTSSESSNAPESRQPSGAFFNWMMAIFSAPFAAASIYAVFRDWIPLGIGPISMEFVEFYETIIVPFFAFVPEWIVGLWGWELPKWYQAVLPVSIVITAAWVRGSLSAGLSPVAAFFYSDEPGPRFPIQAILCAVVALSCFPALTLAAMVGFIIMLFALLVPFLPIVFGLILPANLVVLLVAKITTGRWLGYHVPRAFRVDARGFAVLFYLLNIFLAGTAICLAFVENWFFTGGVG